MWKLSRLYLDRLYIQMNGIYATVVDVARDSLYHFKILSSTLSAKDMLSL